MLLSEKVIRRIAHHLKYKMALQAESELERVQSEHNEGDLSVDGWIRALIDRGQERQLAVVVQGFSERELIIYFEETNSPIVLLQKRGEYLFEPVVLRYVQGKIHQESYVEDTDSWHTTIIDNFEHFYRFDDAVESENDGKMVAITFFPMRYQEQEVSSSKELTPFGRLINMLRDEKDIFYIYVYAIISSLLALSLPLGIQAVFRLVSSGQIITSLILVISFIIVGMLVSGGLQIMQLWLVELLQQRVFAKAAFGFAYRVPRISINALQKYYPPELMNRFFDVITIQKELPKLLVDLSAAALQVISGLLLLSFYHPMFLGVILLTFLFVWMLLYLTFDRGLYTSIKESTYKYKIVHWLEEMARTVNSFRLSTSSRLPLAKMDGLVNHYLYYRKAHFRVLIRQYIFSLVFKVLLVGGLLVIGTSLVVERQISLGQLVAAEVVIILIVSAIEKLVLGLANIYDILTAVVKVAQVTDLPLEKHSGVMVDFNRYPEGLSIRMEDVKASYAGKTILHGINLSIEPGEAICISGPEGAGKHTLMRVLTGLVPYEGFISINGFPLRDIDVDLWRAVIENNFSEDEVFSGTILENIVMGKPNIRMKDVYEAIEIMGLGDVIGRMPDGIHTELLPDGRPLSISERHKLVLARAIVSKPKLLIVIDHFQELQNSEKRRILQYLAKPEHPWTLLMLSNDPTFLSAAHRIIVLEKGKVVAEGSYEALLNQRTFRAFITENV